MLVDDTNGNIPFLFVEGAEADRLLGYDDKPAVPVTMAVRREDFYYHRVSQDIVYDLLFALEGWIPYVDLVQVFDNELGLYISPGFMVTAVVYRDEPGFEKTAGRVPRRVRRRRPAVRRVADVGPGFASGPGRFAASHPAAARRVLDAREHLLAPLRRVHGAEHDAGLVVIGLRGGRPGGGP